MNDGMPDMQRFKTVYKSGFVLICHITNDEIGMKFKKKKRKNNKQKMEIVNEDLCNI